MSEDFKLLKDGWLKVGDGHEIYYAEYGNHDGVPILSIHGGPGSRSKINHLKSLPSNARVILFDQRGCGESRPLGSIENNTTDDLVEDIEKLRNHLGIDKWIVVGGSWGSTLGLIYAERFPDKVVGMGLRSVFLGRRKDIDWVYGNGAEMFCPEYWDRFIKWCDDREIKVSEFVDYGLKVLNGGDDNEKNEVVRVMYEFEGSLMDFDKPVLSGVRLDVSEDDWYGARIYLHYLKHKLFIEDDYVLKNIKRLRGIPIGIVHGRYDLVCPPEQAWKLHERFDNSKIWFTNYAGHHLGYDGSVMMRNWIEFLISTV